MDRCFRVLVLLVAVVSLACDDDPVEPGPGATRSPGTIFVRSDGSGEFPTIQAALNATIDGDTVSLYNGRYSGPGNRDIEFPSRSVVLKSRSGNPVYCVIDCEGSSQDPHSGIFFRSQVVYGAWVEGITIQHSYGAGVHCENDASPFFNNVVFEQNGGTAVYCHSSSPSFADCTFQNNNSGSIACADTSEVLLNDCIFANNFAEYTGASILNESSSVIIARCTFLGNASGFSGAAVKSSRASWAGRPSVTIYDSHFIANVGGYHGGALDFSQTDFSIETSYFSNNECGINGGAFWCSFESAGRIRDCVFYGNSGTKGAAINVGDDVSILIETGIIASNQGSVGVFCDPNFPPLGLELTCTDIYANEGGDWAGCLADMDSLNNNVSVDPMFCDPSSNDFRLLSKSPLLELPCSPIDGWPTGCEAH